MWLPPALLLLCLPGCLSLGGSSFVRGTAGSSLTIRCWYEESYKGYNKYWCRGEHDIDCDKIVETWGEDREQRNGRVSIQDNSDIHTLTVTIRNLHVADAGPYWCKIQTVWILDVWSRDPSFQVQVSVSPAPHTNTGPATHPTTPAATPATFLEMITGQNVSTNREPSSCPGVPLSTVYFLLLVLMKVPLLLSILGVVLCVSRRQTGPGRRRSQLDHGGSPDHRSPPDHGGPPDHWGLPDHCGLPDHGGPPDHWGPPEHRDPPCHAPAPEKPCPGIQLFRLDKRDLWGLHSRTKRQ